MRVPLLNVDNRGGAEQRGRTRKLALLGLAVFVASVLITLAVFFGMRALENKEAQDTFASTADDLTANVFSGFYSSQKNTRLLAEQVRLEVEATGSLPSRRWWDDAVAKIRLRPGNSIGKVWLALRILAADRPAFEAAMTREAKRNISIFSPSTGKRAPDVPSYLAGVYANTGLEPAVGPNFRDVGWSWTNWLDSIRDQLIRSTGTNRAFTSEPIVSLPDPTIYSYSVIPVYVTATGFKPWFKNATGSSSVPVLYCSGGPCRPDFSRDPPDPRADFIISGIPRSIFLHGLVTNASSSKGRLPEGVSELVPLCYPAQPFAPSSAVTYSDYTNTTADPSLSRPCNVTTRKQEIQSQAAPFLLGKQPAYLIGNIIYALQPGRGGAGVVRRQMLGEKFLVAAEEISDSDVWPLTIRAWARDSWVSGTPSLDWELYVKQMKGIIPRPALPPTEHPKDKEVRITGADGESRRFRPSAFSAYTWAAIDAPAFPSSGARFAYALSGDLSFRGITTPCANMSVGNTTDAYVTFCPPRLTLQQYLERSSKSRFRRSFIGLLGGRLHRFEVATVEPYEVDHSNSKNALIGGLVLSGFIVGIAFTVVLTRHQKIRQRQQAAAEGAHNLVVDYCVSEVKHCNDGLVHQLAALQKSLPALSEVDRQLSAEMKSLTAHTASRRVHFSGDVESASDDELRMQNEVDQTRARLLALHAMLGDPLEQLSNDVSVMEVSCEQLHEVSNDFSDYSKLRAGQFEIRHKLVNLRAVIGRAVEAASSGTGTGVALFISPSLPSHALVDPLRIQQVLVNGISNAAKYSRDIRMSVMGLDEGSSVSKLSAVPASSWYKGSKPDMNSLRAQVGLQAPSAGVPAASSSALPSSKNKFLHWKRRSDNPVPASLPPSFVAQLAPSQGVDDDLRAQYLVVEITHRVSLGITPQTGEAASAGDSGAPSLPADAGIKAGGKKWSLASVFRGRKKEAVTAEGIELTTAPPADLPAEPRPDAVPADNDTLQPAILATPTTLATPISGSGRSTGVTSGAASDLALHGTSIGLALSSSLVERMGGYIALHADDGESDTETPSSASSLAATCYSVVLPCWVKEKEGVNVSPAQNETARRRRRTSSLGDGALPAPLASPISPHSVGGALSPTTNHELSLIETRSSGRLNLWRADSGSPLASAKPMMAPSPPGHLRRHSSSTASVGPFFVRHPSTSDGEEGGRFVSAAGRSRAAIGGDNMRPKTLAHVLFADDDLVNRRLGKRMLQRLHCTCDTIDDVSLAAACFERTGQLAVSTAHRAPGELPLVLPLELTNPPRPYDFALFDIICGQTLGWEACKQLKQRGLSRVPIFAMTGNTAPSDLQTYHDAGMENLVLGKPFTVETLERVLEAALAQRAASP